MKNGESDTQFLRDEPCASWHIRITNLKCDKLQLAKETRGHFSVQFVLLEGIFLNLFYLISSVLHYAFKIQILLHMKKHHFIHFCCLFLKSSKSFSVSLHSVYLKSVSRK